MVTEIISGSCFDTRFFSYKQRSFSTWAKALFSILAKFQPQRCFSTFFISESSKNASDTDYLYKSDVGLVMQLLRIIAIKFGVTRKAIQFFYLQEYKFDV